MQVSFTPSGCLDHFQQSFEAVGLSAEAVILAGKARRRWARRTYDSRHTKYYRWCLEHEVDPISATVGQVAIFIVHVLRTGAQACTVQGYRTAIGAITSWCAQWEYCVQQWHSVSLIKGIFNDKPPVRTLPLRGTFLWYFVS